MASAKLYRTDGSEAGTLDLDARVFDEAPNVALVHQVVVALRNAGRHGTHETKTRKDVSGGGVKPFRQKGTGRARQGSIREPQMRGGGAVFGPHSRSYRQTVPVKMRRKALCCALSDRLRDDQLCVLEALSVDKAKTRPMVDLLGKLAPDGRKTLLVTADLERDVLKSSHNLTQLTVRTAADVNALDVVAARRVIMLQDAVKALEERLS